MSSTSRTSQFNKLYKVLKRHYKPVVLDPNRSVLEQLLLACCLENAHHQPADEAFLGLEHNFFDWNEVRVSTVRELAEVMPRLPDPNAAAHRVKRVLQGLFESTYNFDLEDLRKLNLGPATDRLRAIDGTTHFTVAYVVQGALGGHAIPVGEGTFRALRVVALVTEKEESAGVVSGLERAIPKSKGAEFGSLLHQLGADFVANPYAPRLRDILLEINPDAGEHLPKRRARRAAREADGEPQESASPKEAKKGSRDKTGTSAESRESRVAPKKKAGKKASDEDRKKARETATGAQGKKPAAGERADEASVEKKTPAPRKKKAASKKRGDDETPTGPQEDAAKKPPASGLAKKKPR
jgi:endonuclease-3